MKTFISLLVLVSSVLTACSSDSGNTEVDFKPFEKPANAAPQEYAEGLFRKIEDSRKYIPEDETIFSKVLKGAESEVVTSDDKNRKQSLALLSNEGLRFLNNIREKCKITNAVTQRSNVGETVKGVPYKSEGSMSLEGTDCPYTLSATGASEYTVTHSEKNSTSSVISFTLNIQSAKQASINDARVASLSGVKAQLLEMTAGGGLTLRSSLNDTKPTVDGVISGVGKIEYTFSNDEKLTGNLTIYSKSANNKTKTQTLFEAKTAQGLIRVVIVSDGEKNETYLNGTKYEGPFLGVKDKQVLKMN